VQLTHVPTGIVVKCQATRSRSQNRVIARRLLAERLDDLRNGDASRAALKGALKLKRAQSAAKKSRRKYRKLAAAAEEDEERDAAQEAEAVSDVVIERANKASDPESKM
jgi:peptide chain release factor